MNLNKKQLKSIFIKYNQLIYLCVLPICFISYKSTAQENYKLDEMEINRISNLNDEDNLNFPTNPFEIVDMLRRANSMNDATKPSDAIDEAIKSFDMIKEEKQI